MASFIPAGWSLYNCHYIHFYTTTTIYLPRQSDVRRSAVVHSRARFGNTRRLEIETRTTCPSANHAFRGASYDSVVLLKSINSLLRGCVRFKHSTPLCPAIAADHQRADDRTRAILILRRYPSNHRLVRHRRSGSYATVCGRGVASYFDFGRRLRLER